MDDISHTENNVAAIVIHPPGFSGGPFYTLFVYTYVCIQIVNTEEKISLAYIRMYIYNRIIERKVYYM